ncbi:MAG: tetratricopeptide repeat protein [candidate division Zixibacteria bacterium]|nr:tetratricopeptide repeat protein [candidate division Zixibacteria bacterium]
MIALVYYGRKITDNLFSYYSFVLLNVISAITLLFFGYVENYSLVTAFVYIFLLSGISALKNQRKSFVPYIALIIAYFLHKIAIVYLPALVVYTLLTFTKHKTRKYLLEKLKYLTPGLIILFIIFYALIKTVGPLFWKLVFLSPVKDQFTLDNYTLFSPNHLLDFLNLSIFIIPISLLFLIIVLIDGKRKKELYKSIADWKFLTSAAIVGLLSAFIFEPKLCMGRDWDLMSTMFIGAYVAGIYLWIDRYGSNKHYSIITVLLLAINLSIFIPWLSLHNSKKGLAAYSLNISKLDVKHGRFGLFLAIALSKIKNNKTETYMLKQYERINFPEIKYYNKGLEYLNKRDFSKAEEYFNMAIRNNPQVPDLYLKKANCQFSTGRYRESLNTLRIALALNPSFSANHYLIALNYAALGDYDKSLKSLHKSIYHDKTNPDPYMSLGHYYYNTNKFDSSLYYFTCLPDTVFPPEIYYRLGLTQLAMNKNQEAFANFSKYIEVGADSAIIKEIKAKYIK